jgi:hypothetical protein
MCEQAQRMRPSKTADKQHQANIRIGEHACKSDCRPRSTCDKRPLRPCTLTHASSSVEATKQGGLGRAPFRRALAWGCARVGRCLRPAAGPSPPPASLATDGKRVGARLPKKRSSACVHPPVSSCDRPAGCPRCPGDRCYRVSDTATVDQTQLPGPTRDFPTAERASAL